MSLWLTYWRLSDLLSRLCKDCWADGKRRSPFFSSLCRFQKEKSDLQGTRVTLLYEEGKSEANQKSNSAFKFVRSCVSFGAAACVDAGVCTVEKHRLPFPVQQFLPCVKAIRRQQSFKLQTFFSWLSRSRSCPTLACLQMPSGLFSCGWRWL